MCVVCYQPSGIRMEENRKKGGPFVFYDAVQKNGRLQQKLCAFLILILTLRRLMSYIYIYMEHPFLMFLDHTQRRSTVGRTPLDE